MRIRTVKPEFFLHEVLFDLEKKTKLPIRIGFLGLICAADREGRFKWNPRRLKAQIIPYDTADFGKILDALDREEIIVKYCQYGMIPNFPRHQHVNIREAQSTIPAPTETCNARECTCTHVQARGEGNGREGNGREGKENPPTPLGGEELPDSLQVDQFREAWADWKKHRTEIRHPLKQTTEKSQLKKFATWGVAKSVAAIRQSIEQGWQGIFEPDARTPITDDTTPYPAIAESFNRNCGERLAPINHPSDTRKAMMTELYRRLDKDMERVERYFERVGKSNKLMGLYGAQKSTADWLLRWDNAARVLDGQFDNR